MVEHVQKRVIHPVIAVGQASVANFVTMVRMSLSFLQFIHSLCRTLLVFTYLKFTFAKHTPNEEVLVLNEVILTSQYILSMAK